MDCAVIVTAAGSSSRFNNDSHSNIKKEFSLINGKSVLSMAILPFLSFEYVKYVVVTYRKGCLEETKKAVEGLQSDKKIFFTEGGESRRQSVLNALKTIYGQKDQTSFVAIHDGARPFISQSLIKRTFEMAFEKGAAAPAVKLSDTLVVSDKENKISQSLDRTKLRAMQTPQIFSFPDIYLAHVKAEEAGKDYTDDTMVFSDFGKTVFLVDGDTENIKITYAGDITK